MVVPSRRMVFFSWQSDLVNRTNRTLIGDALNTALLRVAADGVVENAPERDEATASIPGSPDIAATILAKIDAAAVVVADISVVDGIGQVRIPTRYYMRPKSTRRPHRPAPNPNVLFEVGYALRALGEARLILIVNAAYGMPETLPFDLKLRRMIQYQLADDGTPPASARNALTAVLTEALRASLAAVTPTLRPAEDPDWRMRLDQTLGTPRWQGQPTLVDLAGSGIAVDTVRIVEQRPAGPRFPRSGSLQPLLLLGSRGGIVPIPAEPIPTPEPCFGDTLTTEAVGMGRWRALIVRWLDREGYNWLAILIGDDDGYHLAQWSVASRDGVFPLGLPYFLRNGTVWRTTPIHHLSFRPTTADPSTHPVAYPPPPSQEVVEELWLAPDALRGGYFGPIPPHQEHATSEAIATGTWLHLTRIWRMQLSGSFGIVEESLVATDPPTMD